MGGPEAVKENERTQGATMEGTLSTKLAVRARAP